MPWCQVYTFQRSASTHAEAAHGHAIANPGPAMFSRPEQLRMWTWDAFICHAGEDKPFAALLHDRLGELGLRSFLDEASLAIGDTASDALEAAVKATQVAVVLLCEEFFQRGLAAARAALVPAAPLGGQGQIRAGVPGTYV